jgi:radical SAM protein with 4Fe4S-binding SPASM domain
VKQALYEELIFEHLMRKASEHNIPISVLLELTYRCNLTCSHCYIDKKNMKELPQQVLKDIIDQLAEQGTLFLTLSGGEIFLRKDFFQIAHYASSKNFAINLFTNGTLINERTADAVAELSPWRVEISIYGAKKETHDGITGVKGSWKKSLNAIKLLKARGVSVILKVLWMKENINEAAEILRLKDNLGVGFRASELISPCSDGCTKPLRHRLDEQQIIALNKLLRNYEKEHSNSTSNIDDNKADLSQINPCGAGINYAAISPCGELYPCVMFPQSVGNIVETSFQKIWKESAFLKKLRDTHLSDLEECKNCPLIFKCPRCPAMTALEEGHFLKSWKEACRIARIASEMEL